LFKNGSELLETFYGEKQPLSDDANLERRTAQALRHYREALAMVENLEREEASAHQGLIEMLPDFERAILENRAHQSGRIYLKLAWRQSPDRTKRGAP